VEVVTPEFATCADVTALTVTLGVPVNPSARAAVPEVFWLPASFTPGRLILEVPSKETPPIVLAFCRAVAVAAFPEVSWLPDWFTTGRLMFAEPSKETPPIVVAV